MASAVSRIIAPDTSIDRRRRSDAAPGRPIAAAGRTAFLDAHARLAGAGEMVLLGPEPPRLESYDFGLCRIGKIAAPAFALRRHGLPAPRGPDLAVTVSRSVTSVHEAAGRRIVAEDSTILVADLRVESVCRCDGFSERVVVYLPRALLPRHVSEAISGPLALTADSGGTAAVFQRAACAAAAQQNVLGDNARQRMQRSLVGLFADLITVTQEADERLGATGLAITRARAIATIEAELTTLNGVEALAERIGCSVRHLYDAFAERNTTPAHYLWSLRLDRAREQIESIGSESSITEVAYSCGFQSYSHFSRAYKKQFGHAPRDAWQQHRTPSEDDQPA